MRFSIEELTLYYANTKTATFLDDAPRLTVKNIYIIVLYFCIVSTDTARIYFVDADYIQRDALNA